MKSFKVNGIDSTSKFQTSTISALPILSLANVSFSLTDTKDGGGTFNLDSKKGKISFTDVNLYKPVSYLDNYLFPLKPTTFNILELYGSVFRIATTIDGNYYELTFNFYE